jgi:hypothetical protein
LDGELCHVSESRSKVSYVINDLEALLSVRSNHVPGFVGRRDMSLIRRTIQHYAGYGKPALTLAQCAPSFRRYSGGLFARTSTPEQSAQGQIGQQRADTGEQENAVHT